MVYILSVLIFSVFLTIEDSFARDGRGAAETRSSSLILVSVGYGKGTFGGSIEYENLKAENFGYVAYGRVYSSLNQETSSNFSPGLMSLGVAVRPHMTVGPIDISISPGVGVAVISSTSRESSIATFGPSLSIAVLYAVNDIWSFGLEQFQLFDWTDPAYRGQVANDVMLKVRYAY